MKEKVIVKNSVVSVGLLALLLMAVMAMPVSAQTDTDVLVGRAVLPANTFAAGPTSGQFIGAGPINGVLLPFIEKQPVQGFSAIQRNDDGSFYAMSDNGFGKQGNSQDYVLRVYEISPDFETAADRSGAIEVEGFIALRDPDELIPFTIVADLDEYPAEGTAPRDNITSGIPVDPAIKEGRLLTGADFDIESIQQVEDGSFWIGDEFGPFLLHVAADGKVLDSPIPLPNVSSPQNPYLEDPAEANLPRSRGFEGMALNEDGDKLYPMLEGALTSDSDQTRRIINEFDLRSKTYTGNLYYYRMENSTHAIGDFIAINEHEFLVIERDGIQGDLNGFKKIFKIDLSSLDSDSFVEKEEVVNLLDISDPDRISLPADPGDIGLGDPFAFPFVTIEDVVIIDSSTLGVLNDNNYPFSTGRNPNKPDDNEFILVRLDETLNTTAPIADSNTTNQRAAFEFALIGDIPRIGDKALKPDLDMFLRLRDEINEDERIRFVIHDGDFKTGSSPCDDINFSRWYGLCNSFKAPFMYVVGDNEWTDCHREKCGGYDPEERFNKLREMFYSVAKSLGGYGLSEMQQTLERQSDNPSDPRYSTFSENFRWVYEDVMFVALNVQGSNNNLGRTPEMDEEFYLRNEACNAFMRESFDRAKENGNLGIMLVIQANPKFEAAPEERTGFNDFLTVLEEETISFEKPVVLVHGDTHYFRIDKPMKSSVSKRRVENFTRVETFGAPDVHWVRATVDENDPNLFCFKQEIVDENLIDHPQQI
jgi:hypothetical protein